MGDFFTYMLLIVAIIISSFYYIKYALYFMQMLQQNSYMPSRYFRWMKQHPYKSVRIGQLVGVLIISALSFLETAWIGLVSMSVIYLLLIFTIEKVKTKKPLVYTTRVKRTIALHGFLYILAIVLILFMESVGLQLLTINMIHVLEALIAVIPIVLLTPVERLVKRRYYMEAKHMIKQHKSLKVIGITGSYGKTSTKHIIEAILSQKYNVLMTPGSYNTTMGNVITIRNSLTTMTEIYIAEMGAKNIGDIKEICDLVQPDIGVLTSIGPQHLETFKSIDNVIRTKFELIDALENEGIAILNGNNANILNHYKAHINKGVTPYLYGKNQQADLEIFAKDIGFTSRGMDFTAVYEGQAYSFNTKLLGSHNVDNLLSGILLGFKLGLTYKQIQLGVKSINPVEHRLQLTRRSDYTLIDDAFNSNPEGAKMAVEVLGAIEGGRKVIITPGMIELGDLQEEANFEFGKQIAKVCDYVILVGKKQTLPIQQGLEVSTYDQERLIIVKDIYEAFEQLRTFIQKEDIVLIENDLPDNYNE